jgi:hypothetical protein
VGHRDLVIEIKATPMAAVLSLFEACPVRAECLEFALAQPDLDWTQAADPFLGSN